LYGLSIDVLIIDGDDSGIPRPGTQGSGAKTAEQLRPNIEDAKIGNSIFYTGHTAVGSTSIGGWDFETTWTISETVNDGYPMLILPIRIYTVTVPESNDYELSCNSSTTISSGGSFLFTVTVHDQEQVAIVKANGEALVPDRNGAYTLEHITSDIEVTVVLRVAPDLAIDAKGVLGTGENEGKIEVSGTIDQSVEASYVKVYAVWKNGSTETVTTSVEDAAFYALLTADSGMSYRIAAFSGTPGEEGTNILGFTDSETVMVQGKLALSQRSHDVKTAADA
jgi:hypothetical protein